ncbi:MAG: LppU/SCO3897 family protein [Pseudonocardiaceae bacterium]
MSRRMLWGIVAGAVVIAGYLYWVNQGRSHYAAVGDCVSAPSAGQLVHVSCDSTGAFRVLAKFDGDDSNKCDAVNGTARAFVEYPKNASSFVLCTGIAATPAK